MSNTKKTKNKYTYARHIRINDDNLENLNRIVQMLNASSSALVNYVLQATLSQFETYVKENMNEEIRSCFKDAVKQQLKLYQ